MIEWVGDPADVYPELKGKKDAKKITAIIHLNDTGQAEELKKHLDLAAYHTKEAQRIADAMASSPVSHVSHGELVTFTEKPKFDPAAK